MVLLLLFLVGVALTRAEDAMERERRQTTLDAANAKIKQIRQADINIRFSGQGSGFTVELQQTSSEFPFGSAVAAHHWNDPSKEKYRQFFLNLFSWAVMENAMKWYSLEPQMDHFNYGPATTAVDSLRSHGITVRGHNIFWAVDGSVPSWQKSMSPDQLKAKMVSHIHKVVGTFKGKVAHWDVNNENLHGSFYATKLHDPSITNWMFQETHKVDPNVLLFLNDYNVVAQGYSTNALRDEAIKMKAAGVPLGALGAQTHIGAQICLDCYKSRLDTLAQAGLPIWITELDINQPDVNKRAQDYDSVLRVLFSHPAVHGIMFWGFWDQAHWLPNAAIATGNDVHPNAAGEKVIHLLKTEWRTNVNQPVSSSAPLTVRGFKGNYHLTIKHNGQSVHQQTFTLGSSGVNLSFQLNGNSVVVG